MNKIGIYSGSFDPIHVGHVEFALAAIKELGLSKVMFLPEALPREKPHVTDVKIRTDMVKLGLAGHEQLELLLVEDAMFTIGQTLPKLQARFAGTNLVFLLGSDVVHTFTYRWEGLKELLQNVELAVGLRASDEAEYIAEIIETIAREYAIEPKYKIIKAPRQHLASTHIRQGSNTIHDVHPSVASYIKDRVLYDDSLEPDSSLAKA